MHRSGVPAERGWAQDRIQDWLATSERMLMITGGAGFGKTRLISGLTMQSGAGDLRVHAVHHCLTRDPTSTDPVRIFASLAVQLARRVPGYGAVARDLRLTDQASHADDAKAVRLAVLDGGRPDTAFERALRNPFEVLASTGRLSRDVVLVVDGLDECTPASSAVLVDLLARQLEPAVPHLRVIATARPSLFTEAPEPGRPAGMSSFDLAADSPDTDLDVAQFLATADLTMRDVSAVATASGGCLLYADLAARLDDQGRLAIRRSDPLPVGLHSLYERMVETQTPFARQVLGLLTRGRGDGLTPRQLTRLLGVSAAEVHEALSGCANLLVGRRRRRPHHRCFGEYFSATAGGAASAELDWLIAEQVIRDAAGNWGSSKRYGLRHVLVHLADVGAADTPADRQRVAARAIRTTVNEPGFLTAALSHVGVDNLLSCLDYVLDRVPTVAADVGRVAELLRAQASTLRSARASRNHRLAAQQLVYEAAAVGANSIGRALVDRMGARSILTLWATVNSSARVTPDARLGHRQQIDDAAIMADGERGVTSASDGVFLVWHLASGQLSHEIDTTGGVSVPHALADASHEIIERPDCVSEVVNVESAERMAFTPERTAKMTAFAVDPDGARGISGDADGNATIWDLEKGEPMLRLICRTDLITAVDITADGWTAVTGSITGHIILWDVATGVAVHRLTCQGAVSALALTPCGTRLIVGDDESISVYEVPDTSQPAPIARLITRSRVTALAVNPAMPSYVLCGTTSGQVAYVRIP